MAVHSLRSKAPFALAIQFSQSRLPGTRPRLIQGARYLKTASFSSSVYGVWAVDSANRKRLPSSLLEDNKGSQGYVMPKIPTVYGKSASQNCY